MKKAIKTLLKRGNRRKRLGIQISIVVGLLGFGAIAAVGILISRNDISQLTQNKGDAVAETAYQVADKLDRGMYERLRDVQVLASLQTLRDGKASVSEKRALLDSLKASFPDYAFIGLTDIDGKVVASANGLLQGASVAARPWFITTKSTQKPNIQDVHEALLLARLLPNPSGEPLRFVDFSAPVFDNNNNFIGVLGSHLSFSWADDVRKSVLENTEKKDQVEVFILSSNNKVLLGPEGTQGKDFDLSGINQDVTSGQYTTKQVSGTNYLTGYAKSAGYKDFAGFGWKIVVQQPTTLAFAAIDKSRTLALEVALAIGVIFALISGFYVRRSLKKEEALERAKDEFVSMASHQLRTPLASMSWLSEALLDAKKGLNKDQQEALEEIHDSSKRLTLLVNTMLNISRIEMGRLGINPKPTDLDELIKENISEVQPLAKEKKVAIEYMSSKIDKMPLDPLLLGQVLHNLLTNAIRYSRQPNAVTSVEVKHTKKEVFIIVKDNGIGIPSEAQKHLFERFYRAENAQATEQDGTGLGLYLIKIILDQSGGRITVKSEQNQGTTFTVILPRSGMVAREGDRKLS